MDKQEPNFTIEAEQAVLAAGLIQDGAFAQLVLLLDADDFYRPAHQKIFKAMRSLLDKGAPIDTISVKDELVRMEQLEDAGGMVYLLQLSDNTFALTHWRHHAGIVKHDALRRELDRLTVGMHSGISKHTDPSEIISWTEGRLEAIRKKDAKCKAWLNGDGRTCPSCSKPVAADYKWCPHCGFQFTD